MSIVISKLVLLNIWFIIRLFLLITDASYSGDYDYAYHELNFMSGHELIINSTINADTIRINDHTNHPSTHFPSYKP